MVSSNNVPEIGQAVRMRNRLATVRAIQPYDSRSPQGQLHLVDLAVYLDGMSKGLHGDPKIAQKDQITRQALEFDSYTVIVIQSRDLNDPEALRHHLKNISQAIDRTR